MVLEDLDQDFAVERQIESPVRAHPEPVPEGLFEEQRAKRLRGDDIAPAPRAVDPHERGHVRDVQLLAATGAGDLNLCVLAHHASSRATPAPPGWANPNRLPGSGTDALRVQTPERGAGLSARRPCTAHGKRPDRPAHALCNQGTPTAPRGAGKMPQLS